MRSLVCSGRDQLVDGILIGWWWGNQESAWSTFWSEVYELVGSMQLLPPGEGFSICKTDKDIIVCIPWREIRTCPKAVLLFLDYSSIVFTSLSFLYSVQFSSVAQLCPTLRPHGLQHARLPSPTTGSCSNTWPLSWWCHLTISFSVIPFSYLQSFPASWYFPNKLALCIKWPKYWNLSFSISPVNIRGWFPLGLTGLISMQSKGLSRVFSNTTV